MKLKPKYITDTDGKRTSVILSLAEFESLMELLEDLEDVRLYDNSKKEHQTLREAETVFKKLDKKKYN